MKSKNYKMSKEYININNYKFEFFLIRKNVKNINIRIKPDKSVYISCPIKCKDYVVKEAIVNKFNWIVKQINKINNVIRETNEFKDNGFIYFLGNKYIVKIVEDDKNNIYFYDNFLYINVNKKHLNNYEYIEKLYNKFCYEYAFNLYQNIAFKFVDEIFYKYITKSNLIVKVRNMKTKWGVCMPYKNKITINLSAIKLPINCIEYIIFHELSHFVYHNHSKDFYNFIGKYIKDYKLRIRLINEKYKYIV